MNNLHNLTACASSFLTAYELAQNVRVTVQTLCDNSQFMLLDNARSLRLITNASEQLDMCLQTCVELESQIAEFADAHSLLGVAINHVVVATDYLFLLITDRHVHYIAESHVFRLLGLIVAATEHACEDLKLAQNEYKACAGVTCEVANDNS